MLKKFNDVCPDGRTKAFGFCQNYSWIEKRPLFIASLSLSLSLSVISIRAIQGWVHDSMVPQRRKITHVRQSTACRPHQTKLHSVLFVPTTPCIRWMITIQLLETSATFGHWMVSWCGRGDSSYSYTLAPYFHKRHGDGWIRIKLLLSTAHVEEHSQG